MNREKFLISEMLNTFQPTKLLDYVTSSYTFSNDFSTHPKIYVLDESVHKEFNTLQIANEGDVSLQSYVTRYYF